MRDLLRDYQLVRSLAPEQAAAWVHSVRFSTPDLPEPAFCNQHDTPSRYWRHPHVISRA